MEKQIATRDVYTLVTNQIIQLLEQGTVPCTTLAQYGASAQLNHSTSVSGNQLPALKFTQLLLQRISHVQTGARFRWPGEERRKSAPDNLLAVERIPKNNCIRRSKQKVLRLCAITMCLTLTSAQEFLKTRLNCRISKIRRRRFANPLSPTCRTGLKSCTIKTRRITAHRRILSICRR